MHTTRQLLAALLSTGVFSRVAIITLPPTPALRATSTYPACILTPRVAFPGVCSANLGTYSFTTSHSGTATSTVQKSKTTPQTSKKYPPAAVTSVPAIASVYVGNSAVHVGTLTGTALYTSISSALNELCPPVTQTTSMTQCKETDTVKIKGIDYVDADKLLQKGELVVNVATIGYNITSLRDAMIHSAALAAQNSATGSNCYSAQYEAEQLRKRGPLAWIDGLLSPSRWGISGLTKREVTHPTSEHITLCNAAWFASVMYYSPYWRVAPTPGPTDFIDADWVFQVGPGGDFACEFLQYLGDALVAVEPEFAVGDVELGEELKAICQEAHNRHGSS